MSITRLQSKVKSLNETKTIRDIMNEPFIGKGCQRKKDTVVQCMKTARPTFDVKVFSTVNRELAGELAMTKEALNLQEMQMKELEAKFSKLSVRNTNKKLRQRDDQIAKLKEEVIERRRIENRLKQTELSCQQLAEELGSSDNLTLHSDGSSKFGQHYYSFQVSTPSSTYSLGLSEMLTGSANQVLHTFKQILSDLQLVAGPNSGGFVLAKIKNTMSDRHIVEKNFNSLLEDYRKDVLPTVVESWDQMTPEQQSSVSTLNNFFGGMHLLVGMADTASSTLLQWKLNHFEGTEGPAGTSVLVRKSESGVGRLVRTACKALSKHGSEQSGVYQSFTSFLESNGIKRNPLASFRGNRFYILFYDAGALYYISNLVKIFFCEVWQTPNQLLRAVLSDIQVPEYLAGCRALGLVNKVITGPLWRVLGTPDISILDMNEYLQMLIAHLDLWSLDASEVLAGEAVLYPDFPPYLRKILFGIV